MKVQAFMLVPIWKLARASHAFIMASCARSSAAVGSPVRVRAKARRCGMSLTSSFLKMSSRSGSSPATAFGCADMLAVSRGLFGLTKYLKKLVGHRLVDHLVEHL